jgi:peroxiredoxin
LTWFRKKDKQNSIVKDFSGSVGNAYPEQILPAGSQAPDFTLVDPSGEDISLADYRGKSVILAFYPADWSPVCGDQLVLYNEVLPLFEEYNAQLLGISVDGRWSHRAFTDDRNLNFPLLSDFEPKGEVAKKYGVYDHKDGLCERALFVIDAQGVIQWSYLSPPGINPGADGILSALESIMR